MAASPVGLGAAVGMTHTLIFAIDPGPEKSGYCIFDSESFKVVEFGEPDNQELKNKVRAYQGKFAIETIVSYGMAVGKTTFKTCFFIGQLQQIIIDKGCQYEMISRQDVKLNLCFSARAKDTNVNQAVRDLFPASGRNGKGEPCVKGTKKHQGPLYGFANHAYSALAIALTSAGIDGMGDA